MATFIIGFSSQIFLHSPEFCLSNRESSFPPEMNEERILMLTSEHGEGEFRI